MSIRQEKVSRLIQKELGIIFQQKLNQLLHNKLISVTVVRITVDLKIAKVYLSIFPSENSSINLKTIEAHYHEIRKELGNKVKNQLRIIPELNFYIDDSLDYAENIEKLLHN